MQVRRSSRARKQRVVMNVGHDPDPRRASVTPRNREERARARGVARSAGVGGGGRRRGSSHRGGRGRRFRRVRVGCDGVLACVWGCGTNLRGT